MEARIKNEGRNYNPHRRLDILTWMQNEIKNNPRVFRDTSVRVISHRYALSHPEVASSTIEVIVLKMIKANLISKTKTGGRRASFRINYLHPNLPKEFVANASPDEKDFVKRVMDSMEEKKANGENVSMTTDGTIVTKPKVVIEPKPEEKPETIQATVPVSVEKDGQTLSITINLNLNLRG